MRLLPGIPRPAANDPGSSADGVRGRTTSLREGPQSDSAQDAGDEAQDLRLGVDRGQEVPRASDQRPGSIGSIVEAGQQAGVLKDSRRTWRRGGAVFLVW